MTYATLAEFKTRLGSSAFGPAAGYEALTDRVNSTTANDAVGQEILDGAHGILHFFLVGRYEVPLDTTDDPTLATFLKETVLTLAAYLAWQTHPARDRMKESVSSAYTNTTGMLGRIAAGTHPLPSEAPLPESVVAGLTGQATGASMVFDEDALREL